MELVLIISYVRQEFILKILPLIRRAESSPADVSSGSRRTAAGPAGDERIVVRERELPGLHGLAGHGHKLLHAEHAVGRAFGRPLQFAGFHRGQLDLIQAGFFQDFSRKIIPGAAAAVGYVENAAGVFGRQRPSVGPSLWPGPEWPERSFSPLRHRARRIGSE